MQSPPLTSPQHPQAWIVRKARQSDIPFIYDTFLKNIKHCSRLGKSCRSPIFFKNYQPILDHILQQSQILVACAPNNDDIIYGYAVFQRPTTLHFVFVKELFRNFGIATTLLTDALGPTPLEVQCTHKTMLVDPIFKKHAFLQFNPFLLYQKETPPYASTQS